MVVNAEPNNDPPVVLRVVVIADTGFESLLNASLNLFVTCITNGTPIPIAIPVSYTHLTLPTKRIV